VSASRAGRDIQLVGSLFLAVGLVDLLIIELFPAYVLKLFGVVMPASLAYPVKMHSPAVHFLIGYGFLFLRPWAWGLAVAYGGFGLLSELMNQLAFGFHYLRSGFMGATCLFIGYLLWRRHLFTQAPFHDPSIGPASQEVP
jgi:hypothetical protein